MVGPSCLTSTQQWHVESWALPTACAGRSPRAMLQAKAAAHGRAAWSVGRRGRTWAQGLVFSCLALLHRTLLWGQRIQPKPWAPRPFKRETTRRAQASSWVPPPCRPEGPCRPPATSGAQCPAREVVRATHLPAEPPGDCPTNALQTVAVLCDCTSPSVSIFSKAGSTVCFVSF